MTTDAPDTTGAPEATGKPPTWRLDTDNGSLRPRSALDVLVDLNDKVTSGQVSEYQPVHASSRDENRRDPLDAGARG